MVFFSRREIHVLNSYAVSMKVSAHFCSRAVIPLLALASILSAQGGSATWDASPPTNNWNTAGNWNPATVPNGQTDDATFSASNQTAIEMTSDISLGGVFFTSTAPAYTISLDSGRSLQLYDSGMSNSSIFAPTFVANDSAIAFHNSSSVANVALTLNASSPGLASVTFDAGTSAFSALITANGGACTFAGGTLDFATVLLRGGTSTNPTGGYGDLDGANGASARVYSGAAAVERAEGGIAFLHNGATAGDGLFSSDGSFFPEQATAGLVEVDSSVDLGSAAFTGNGGVNGGAGGMIKFDGVSHGKGASVTLSGNAIWDMSYPLNNRSLYLASLNGEGNVFLGGNTLVVGTGNYAFGFAGNIQDGGVSGGIGGRIIKVGKGKFSMTGPSTYTGGTTVQSGPLLVSNTVGSATGTGEVSVAGGKLAGSGIIAGPVTVASRSGHGASLEPNYGSLRGVTLTIQSLLAFQVGANYRAHLNTGTPEVVANGVIIESGAQLLLPSANRALPPGRVYTLISNTGATPIAGTFDNLPDGATITSGSNVLQASYEGGDGNDFTLTVLP